MERQTRSRLQINSFDELLKHEKEIVDRIAEFPNGGNLFMAHPFLLLADIGVELSEQARAEIFHQEPYLSGGLSPTAYNALRATNAKQRIRFHVRGLFRGRTE